MRSSLPYRLKLNMLNPLRVKNDFFLEVGTPYLSDGFIKTLSLISRLFKFYLINIIHA